MVGFGDFLKFCFYILFIFFAGKAIGVIDADQPFILRFDLLRRCICRYLQNSSIVFHSRLLEDADRLSEIVFRGMTLPAIHGHC